jgi:hypothetical protein
VAEFDLRHTTFRQQSKFESLTKLRWTVERSIRVDMPSRKAMGHIPAKEVKFLKRRLIGIVGTYGARRATLAAQHGGCRMISLRNSGRV